MVEFLGNCLLIIGWWIGAVGVVWCAMFIVVVAGAIIEEYGIAMVVLIVMSGLAGWGVVYYG
jgi:hypothetical protein